MSLQVGGSGINAEIGVYGDIKFSDLKFRKNASYLKEQGIKNIHSDVLAPGTERLIMEIRHSQVDAHRASFHPALQNPIATHPEDARVLAQFRPMPLSWLVTWLFRPRAEATTQASEPEPFEEHMNGLA